MVKSNYNQVGCNIFFNMEVVIILNLFGIKVFNKFELNLEYVNIFVWEIVNILIYYIVNGIDDYVIIQLVKKLVDVKYIGFGEQGGIKFSKNMDQLNYFNFDNMCY